MTVNVTDMGTCAFNATVGPNASPIFALRDDDPNLVFGDAQDDFQDFLYSPFIVHQTSDDNEASTTKAKLNDLNEKLDPLLESSEPSSISEDSFMDHKALIESFTKEHAKSLAASSKSVENSEQTVEDATKKVES